MARRPLVRALQGTRLLKAYGGWMYCDACNETIGYLCYVTYDAVAFRYQCKCGGQGALHIAFAEESSAQPGPEPMVPIGNRLCCPQDRSPLVTIRASKLDGYYCEITCAQCRKRYLEEKT